MNSTAMMKSRVVNFKLLPQDPSNPNLLHINGARVLNIESFQCGTQKLDPAWTHCQDLGIPPDIEPSDVKILIGIDNPEAHLPLKTRRGLVGQPLAVRTVLGWSVMGFELEDTRDARPAIVNNLINSLPTSPEPPLDELLWRFWSTESFGVGHDFNRPTSTEDRSATTQLETTTVKEEGHYTVGMLWRDPNGSLPDNLPVARRRFGLLTRKLEKDSE
jgi:hypothetical protein